MAFRFIGWCCEDNHDKIWGYFDNGEPTRLNYGRTVQPVYVFWGARGKKNTIHFKEAMLDYELEKLTEQKKHKKHYEPISQEKLLKVWPTFFEDVDMKLCFDVLANRVRK